MKLSKVAILGLAVIFSNPVSGAIINIPGDYSTIQLGINAGSTGDTVLVQPGIYVENINYNGLDITVASLFLTTADLSYIDSTIIDGNSTGSVVLFESGESPAAVIAGFTLRNGRAQFGGGVSCATGSSPTILRNKIINNTADQSGGGISCWSDANAVITNNIIAGNSALSFGGGIMCSANSNAVFTGNTITANNAAQGGGGISSWSSNPTITNCIFWGDEAGGVSNEISGTAVVTYCDVQGGWSGTGNINCDPQFCDPAIGNYYLDSGSCCVGNGQGGADIGAYGVGCPTGGCDYVVGDVNGSQSYNGLDVTYGVAFFKGGSSPICDVCQLCPDWHYCGDVNGSCSYNGLDITYGVAYFKGGSGPLPCPDCPPAN